MIHILLRFFCMLVVDSIFCGFFPRKPKFIKLLSSAPFIEIPNFASNHAIFISNKFRHNEFTPSKGCLMFISSSSGLWVNVYIWNLNIKWKFKWSVGVVSLIFSNELHFTSVLITSIDEVTYMQNHELNALHVIQVITRVTK